MLATKDSTSSFVRRFACASLISCLVLFSLRRLLVTLRTDHQKSDHSLLQTHQLVSAHLHHGQRFVDHPYVADSAMLPYLIHGALTVHRYESCSILIHGSPSDEPSSCP